MVSSAYTHYPPSPPGPPKNVTIAPKIHSPGSRYGVGFGAGNQYAALIDGYRPPPFDPVLPFGLPPDVTDMLVGLVPPPALRPPAALPWPPMPVPLLALLVMTWPGIVADVAPIPLQLVAVPALLAAGDGVAMSVSPPASCAVRLVIVCRIGHCELLVFGVARHV